MAGRRIVLARRSDGLGERLNALLNAMRLADLLDVDFGFAWPHELVDDPTHAIEPPEEIFSSEFRAEHLIDDDAITPGFVAPQGRAPDLESLRRQLLAADGGLLAPNRWLGRIVDRRSVPEVSRGYSTEFARIGFHPRIEAATSAAAAAPLSDGAAGLHLRGGDVFTSHFEDWNRFTPKIMPAPVARALAERFRAEGRDVVIFGQDRALIEHLCTTTGAIDGATLRPSLDRAAAAMFDVAVLSRCDPLVGGNSGFVRLAAISADKKVSDFRSLVPDPVEITRRDMAAHGSHYSPTQRGFAWWAAYFFARDDLDPRQAIDLLTRAVDSDPTHPNYRLTLAALLHRNGQTGRGDAVLTDALAADVSSGEDTLRSVMVLSSIRPSLVSMASGTRQDNAEIIGDLEDAGARGPGPASIYRAALRGARGDAAGALDDLTAFRDHVARSSNGTDPRRLDHLATTTIEHRIEHAGPPA